MNPAEDWRALTENYRSMSDGQLCELAESLADLTPTAQQVLRDEMKLRNLGDPQASGWGHAEKEVAPQPEPEGGPAVVFTWKTPLCNCDRREEAWQVAEVLRRAGIECWIDRPRAQIDAAGQVLVAADQLDEARAIIANPIPPEIVEESYMTPPEYELPVCPQCGAADPILESVDPVNTWKCESCGKEWADADPESAE